MKPVTVPDIQNAANLESGDARLDASRAEALRIRRIRIVSWCLLILAGAIQTWYYRHKIFSDGVSYLEVASYYLQGNWHAALNSYWSPLYSWILAAFLFVLRPNPYWDSAVLHLVNFFAYLASLAVFDLILHDLVRLQRRIAGDGGVSEATLRITGYSLFLVGSLLSIGIGYNSPDMVAMALMFYLLHVLLRIEAGTPTLSTYVLFGIALGLEFLCRSAFAAFIVLYLGIAGVLLWRRRTPLIRPLSVALLAALCVAAPFVTALDISKGRFTLGDAGKLNYGWEIDGAARSTNWQGEPYNIGRPLHPTHKVMDHPAVYTFASPVPGSYPPWYEPSYWYQGIQPRFEIRPELTVFLGSLAGVVYLFLRSPVALPVLVLIFLMGWRRWLSQRGIFPYWFLILPTAAYVAGYMLVYMDPRYVAGSVIIISMCLLASISLPHTQTRRRMDATLQALALVFALVFLIFRFNAPARATASDLLHGKEGEHSLSGMIAERMRQMGVHRGDRVAFIGQSMDAEWARILGIKIVAEIPVIWYRGGLPFRRVYDDKSEVESFWNASPEQKQRVFEAFRKAGATIVLAQKVPPNADQTGWERLLPAHTPYLPKIIQDGQEQQFDLYQAIALKRID